MGMRWGAWRRHPRVIPDPQAPVGVTVALPALPAPLTVYDISEGGIDLQAPAALDSELVGQAMVLTLRLPEPAVSLELRGKIVHVDGYRVGVVFQGMLPADRSQLRRYVDLRRRAPSLLSRLRMLLES